MVDIPAAPDVSPQAHRGASLAGPFETMSRRYAAMDLNGCTDEERGRARIMVRVTHQLAILAARQPRGTPSANLESAPSAVRDYISALMDFENRRLAMQRDLDKMRSVRLVK